MLLLAIMFLLLGFIAIILVVAVVLSHYEGTMIEKFETLISSHDGLLVSLGTLLLVTALAVFTTHLAGKFADLRERANRSTSAQLKLAEFRQMWISEMRADIAELIQLSFHSTSQDDVAKEFQLSMKIQMRLNPDEPLACTLTDCLEKIAKSELRNAEHKLAIANLVLASRNYLKVEWTRLKSDIETAQVLVE